MSMLTKCIRNEPHASNALSYAVVGLVVAGGTWYLTRLARGPTSAFRSRHLHVQSVTTCLQSSGPRRTLHLGMTSRLMRAQKSSQLTRPSINRESFSPPKYTPHSFTPGLGGSEGSFESSYNIFSNYCRSISVMQISCSMFCSGFQPQMQL